MTSRWKALPWAVGVVLLVATLLGARHLLDRDDAGKGAAPRPAAVGSGAGGSVTVLGTVTCDPPETPVGPPAVAALLTVERVLVAEGQAVNVGDPLVQFDDRLLREKVPQAKAELAAAREDGVKAEAQKAGHPIQLRGQELLIRTLQNSLKENEELYRIGRDQFERFLDSRTTAGTTRTPAEREQERRENLDLRKADLGLTELRAKIEGEGLKLDALRLTPVEADVRAAAAKVARLTHTVAEAEAAVASCLVRARAAGVVEQVYATPGQTYGPGTRPFTVLWVIPAGRRVVRAEVEPEFAPRVADKEGRKVTITDGNNFALTYEGTVRRVGTSYLPKRSQLDSLAVAPTKVLECVIDVTDPAPPGKPPLRVGQPVRVSFP